MFFTPEFFMGNHLNCVIRVSAADAIRCEGHCLTNTTLGATKLNENKTVMCQEHFSRRLTYSLEIFLSIKNLCIIYTSFELTGIHFFHIFGRVRFAIQKSMSFFRKMEIPQHKIIKKLLRDKWAEIIISGADTRLNGHAFLRARILPPFVHGTYICWR